MSPSKHHRTEKRQPYVQQALCSLAMLSAFSIALALLASNPWTSAELLAPSTHFKDRCLSFEPEKLVENSGRTRLEYVTNGTRLDFPDNNISCNRASQLVSAPLCRIALHVATSERSGITLELWLPDKWDEKRFISTGNGGIDGCKSGPQLLSGPGAIMIDPTIWQVSSMRTWLIRLPTALRPWGRTMGTMALRACDS
jgi:hypothetical protein